MKTIFHPPGSGIRIATYLLVAGLTVSTVTEFAAADANAVSTASPITDQSVRSAIKELPAYIKQVMERTGVPGISVAVVHEDQLLYAQGFGVRSTETGTAVTPDTVFQIASVSKPLGATAVAAAISTGALSWDTPVAPLVAGFSLSDPTVLPKVTIGDLYAHRSGLPGDYGNDLFLLGFDRDEILARGHLVPLSPFREAFSYSNFGLTVAGVAAAAAAGRNWEKFSEDFIFSPLGMVSSTYSYAAFRKMTNTAALHQKVDERWVAGPELNVDIQAPAGGANSNVLDLSRWMRMILSEGMFEGRRIVSEEALASMLAPQIKIAADTASGSSSYGFGMVVDVDSRGKTSWIHSGDFSHGASTQIYLDPELELGVVTLTNGWPIGVPEAINATFVDFVRLGRPTRDWLTVFSEELAADTEITRSIDGKKRPNQPKDASELKSYSGDFSSDYAGEASIIVEGHGLMLVFGPRGQTRVLLHHWDGDVFYFNEFGMPEGFYTAVRFRRDDKGNIISFKVDMVSSGLGVFNRKP
jgi:CubicO group peptidase (beta-lactamase class C family)